MADRTLELIVKFLVDRASAAEARKAVEQVSGQKAGTASGGYDQKTAEEINQWMERAATSSKKVQMSWIQSTEAAKGMSQQVIDIADYMRAFQVSAQDAAKALYPGETATGLLNPATIKQAETLFVDGSKELAQNTEQAMKNVQMASRAMPGVVLGITGFTLSMTGMQLQQLGKNILSPIGKYAEKYGTTSETAQGYTDAVKSMEDASLRVGAALTKAVLPALEFFAQALNDIANWIEDNPALAGGIATVGGGLLVSGIALSTLGQVLAGLGSLKNLAALAKTSTLLASISGGIAGGAAALAPALSSLFKILTSAPVAGAAIGVTGYNAIAKAQGWQSAGEIAGKTFTVLAYKAGTLFGPEVAAKWGKSIGELTGVIEKADEATDKLGPSSEAVSAYIEYLQKDQEAEESYQDDRQKVIKDSVEKLLDLEKDYVKDRQDLISSYNESIKSLDEDYQSTVAETRRDALQEDLDETSNYYKRRAELARDYEIDVQRAEEDHQREMLQLQRDHALRLEELIESRDALGIINEMRTYEENRTQKEEEYQIEAARRSEDFARKLADLEAEFSQERAVRQREALQRQAEALAEYQQKRLEAKAELEASLKDLEEKYLAEREQTKLDEAEKLKELSDEYTKERLKRQNAFADQLRDLDDSLLQERDIKNAYYQAMTNDLVAWTEAWRGLVGSNLPGYPISGSRASGGYVDQGIYQLHQGEYVLSSTTARLAERMTGGRLSQNSLVQALLGAGSADISVQQNMRFTGEVSAGDRRSIQKIAKESAMLGLVQGFQGL